MILSQFSKQDFLWSFEADPRPKNFTAISIPTFLELL